MGIARRLEERLERLVDGVSAAFFRGKMRPIDLGHRLVRLADLNVEERWFGPTIPNVYRLFVVEADLGGPNDAGYLHSLGPELAHTLRVTAEEAGWSTRGPVTVTAEPAQPGARTTTVETSSVPGPLRPWGQLVAVRDAAILAISDNRAGIGRGSDTDVRIDSSEVSRHHAVMSRQHGRLWLHDVGSTNGTWHNDRRIGVEPVPIAPGDGIRFGGAAYTFRTV